MNFALSSEVVEKLEFLSEDACDQQESISLLNI